ncbi:Conserved_hypothetical protein [Hexamita inflata]|uniref:Uncharacterized protein n=1 Tax=Hexamita inflata TaxID=28002 RepID=A0ABP1GGX2_9EUKA
MRLPFGTQIMVQWLMKSIVARYGEIAKTIQLDVVQQFFEEHAGWSGINDDFMTWYRDKMNTHKNTLNTLLRPEADSPESINYLLTQNQYLFAQYPELLFLPTQIQFKSLFDQQKNIQRREFAEKARAASTQKLINLAQLSEEDIEAIHSLKNDVEIYNLIISKCTTKLKELKKGYEKLNQNNAQALLDELTVNIQTDQILDLSKLKTFQIEQIENVSISLEYCVFKLRELKQTPDIFRSITYLPIQFGYEGAFVDNQEEVVIPVVNEHIIAAELMFNPKIIGVSSKTVEEMLRELVKEDNAKKIIISGGGSGLKNIKERVEADLAKLGVDVELRRNEWADLCAFIQ